MDSFVLESLSKATNTLLDKPRLWEGDSLRITLTKSGDKFIVELLGDPYPSQAAKSFFNRVPEVAIPKEWRYSDKYVLAGTDFTALLLYHCWPAKALDFSAEARLLYTYLVGQFLSQGLTAKAQAEYKLNKQMPVLPEDWKEHPEWPLADYQRVAATLAVGKEGFGLFMDPGTGKTIISIQRAMIEAQQWRQAGNSAPYKFIVVCPGAVRKNWLRELERFSWLPGKAVVMRGTLIQRVSQLVECISTRGESTLWQCVIISYDSIANSLDALKLVPWNLGIADESHNYKSNATKRWKEGVKVLRESCAAFMPLTGTPIGNSLMDLWTQLESMYTGASGFMSFRNYRDFHGRWKDVEGLHGVQKLLATKNVPLLQERLARLSFSITQEEAGLQLPDPIPGVIEIEMSEKQAKLYRKIASEIALEIENTDGAVVDSMTIANTLVKLLRLHQITSGFITWDPIYDEEMTLKHEKRVEQISDKNPKIDTVCDMLTEEMEANPLAKKVIWCHWKEDNRQVYKRLVAAGFKGGQYYGDTSQQERDVLERAFNYDPGLRFIVCSAKSAGEGLNLLGYDYAEKTPKLGTYVDHVVYVSYDWSYIKRRQSMDRTQRRGTRMPIRVDNVVVPGTIDEHLIERVEGKAEMAVTARDLKDVLTKVLNV